MIIADDHADSANMLAVLVRVKTGAAVLVAYDGAAALGMALAQPPHAVILDLDMPVMDGIAAAQALRKSLAPPPVLIGLSGNVHAVASLQAQGVFDHALSKPVDMRRLAEILA